MKNEAGFGIPALLEHIQFAIPEISTGSQPCSSVRKKAYDSPKGMGSLRKSSQPTIQSLP